MFSFCCPSTVCFDLCSVFCCPITVYFDLCSVFYCPSMICQEWLTAVHAQVFITGRVFMGRWWKFFSGVSGLLSNVTFAGESNLTLPLVPPSPIPGHSKSYGRHSESSSVVRQCRIMAAVLAVWLQCYTMSHHAYSISLVIIFNIAVIL